MWAPSCFVELGAGRGKLLQFVHLSVGRSQASDYVAVDRMQVSTTVCGRNIRFIALHLSLSDHPFLSVFLSILQPLHRFRSADAGMACTSQTTRRPQHTCTLLESVSTLNISVWRLCPLCSSRPGLLWCAANICAAPAPTWRSSALRFRGREKKRRREILKKGGKKREKKMGKWGRK
jgi:hypothetical protein